MVNGCVAAAVLGSVLVLTGCGTTALSSRNANPVIQDFNFRWWSDASTLATTASRRLALMFYRKDANGQEIVQSCAEPPPDVGETFAKALAAQIELGAEKGGAEAHIQASVATRVATAIAPLMARTQGLQLMRDSSFALCIDYMNGWIKDAEAYERVKHERFNQAVRLIELEIPILARRASELAAPELPKSEQPPNNGRRPSDAASSPSR